MDAADWLAGIARKPVCSPSAREVRSELAVGSEQQRTIPGQRYSKAESDQTERTKASESLPPAKARRRRRGGKAAAMEPGTMERMVALTESALNESYAEPSPYAWLRTRAPVPTTYAPACESLYPFQEILENRTSRARGMTDNCAEVPSRKCLICIEIWQVELEDGVWRVSFHKYAYVHGDPIQGVDPTGKFLGVLVGVGLNIGGMSQELVTGGLITGLLQSVGKPAFDLRAMGLALIAQGDFEVGFKLYDVSTAVISKAFETIETIDGAIGLAGIGPAILVGAFKLARNSPELAQTAMNATNTFFQTIKSLASKGKNLTEIFNRTKYVFSQGPAQAAKAIDAIMALQTRASLSAKKPQIDTRKANQLVLDRHGKQVFGRYDPVDNKIYLYQDHDAITIAEELKHWEDHTRNLNGISYSQFGDEWKNLTRAQREEYIDDLEADAESWFNSIGMIPRTW